ncbi:MAG: hypothetical protein CSA21_03110 [Deltaproteobacteria bacterium]|nr:MAG: hypothetical protein CSA21_03110 [Deltaproteobacteria bacterium]
MIIFFDGNREHLAVMRYLIRSFLPGSLAVGFANVWAMIAWMRAHPRVAAVISLGYAMWPGEQDIDRLRGGYPGSALDIVDYLSGCQPFAHVILHTENQRAMAEMAVMLNLSGWDCSAVTPGNGTSWIERAWLPEVERRLHEQEQVPSSAPFH